MHVDIRCILHNWLRYVSIVSPPAAIVAVAQPRQSHFTAYMLWSRSSFVTPTAGISFTPALYSSERDFTRFRIERIFPDSNYFYRREFL